MFLVFSWNTSPRIYISKEYSRTQSSAVEVDRECLLDSTKSSLSRATLPCRSQEVCKTLDSNCAVKTEYEAKVCSGEEAKEIFKTLSGFMFNRRCQLMALFVFEFPREAVETFRRYGRPSQREQPTGGRGKRLRQNTALR